MFVLDIFTQQFVYNNYFNNVVFWIVCVVALSVRFPESFQYQNVPIMHFLAQLLLQEELKEYQISLSKFSPLKSIQKINLVKLLVFYYVIEASFSPEKKNYATTNSLYKYYYLLLFHCSWRLSNPSLTFTDFNKSLGTYVFV